MAENQPAFDVVSNKAQGQSRLVLFAGSGNLLCAKLEPLVQAMSQIGLIGSSVGQSGSAYYPGDRFIDHVSFLGCSPNIALSPAEGEHYCFVRFYPVQQDPVLHSGSNTRPPRCRQCERLVDNWLQCAAPDFCEQCTLEQRQDNLNWRRQGAFSRWIIDIMNIYPHEAVPSSLLLASLQQASGVEWRYAYLQQ
jgi:hypothetical protein